jgi:hypothetical protein
MYPVIALGIFIVLIFAVEMFRESRRQSAWRRRRKDKDGDDAAS